MLRPLPSLPLSRLALAAGLTLGVAACDELDPALYSTDALTFALTVDDAASSDAVDEDTDEVASLTGETDGATMTGGSCSGGGGKGGHHGGGKDGAAFALDLEGCAPPVADEVDTGRAGRPPHHLFAIYDEDESDDLDDDELAALEADLIAGCEARNLDALANFDVDGSGDLDQEEWDTLRETKRAERDETRAALDLDGDGEISPEEHQAAEDEVIATWDLDESGELDEDERAAMREDLQALVRAGERLPPLPMDGARHHHRPPPPADATSTDDA